MFLEAMASCTAVTYVEGELVGDPLDVKMFEKTGWMLDETDQSLVSVSGEDQLVIAYVYPEELKHHEIQNVGYGSMSSSDAENSGRPSSKPYKSALIRRFDFSSSLQRMSVICKNQFDGKFKAFVKGSPEMISSLCQP